MLAAHPLWRQEFAASSYAKPLPPERMSSVGHPSIGGSSSGTLVSAETQRKFDLAWEATLDELEDFVFRKIGSALLPAPPAPLALGWGSDYRVGSATNGSSAASNDSAVSPSTRSCLEGEPVNDLSSKGDARDNVGSGGALLEEHQASPVIPLPLQRLRHLGWLRSSDLGVPWAGFDEDEDDTGDSNNGEDNHGKESSGEHMESPSRAENDSPNSPSCASGSFSRGHQKGWALAAEQLVAFGGPRPPREKLASLALCFDLVSKKLTQVLRKARLHNASASASRFLPREENESSGGVTPPDTSEASGTSRERTSSSSSSSSAHHISRGTIPRPRFDSSRSAFEDQMRSALTNQLSPAALAVADAADGDSLASGSASSFVTSHGESLLYGWDDHSGFQWRKTAALHDGDDDCDDDNVNGDNDARKVRASSLQNEGLYQNKIRSQLSAAAPSLHKRVSALSMDANSFMPSSHQLMEAAAATDTVRGNALFSAEVHDEGIDQLEQNERRAMPANPQDSSRHKRDSQQQPATSLPKTATSDAVVPSKGAANRLSDNDMEAEDLPSADDVLPAAILVLLRAAPQLAFSPLPELEYALSFRSRARLSPEAHYFGVTLCSAAQFLANLSGPDVGLSPSEFEARMRTAQANEFAAEAAEACAGDSSWCHTTADSRSGSESSNDRMSSFRAMQNRRGSWDGGIGGERSGTMSPKKHLHGEKMSAYSLVLTSKERTELDGAPDS